MSFTIINLSSVKNSTTEPIIMHQYYPFNPTRQKIIFPDRHIPLKIHYLTWGKYSQSISADHCFFRYLLHSTEDNVHCKNNFRFDKQSPKVLEIAGIFILPHGTRVHFGDNMTQIHLSIQVSFYANKHIG